MKQKKTLFDQDITLDEAKELIKNGADVNEEDAFNNTPLFQVLNIDIALLLILHNANVNHIGFQNKTPLFHVLNPNIANLLIVHGADVNHFTSRGETPLFYANNIDIIDLFVKHGAYVNKCDIHGNSVLDSLYRLSTPQKDIKRLIKYGFISGKIENYKKYRELFIKEQQKAFDTFASITNNDDDFFQMCLAYQEGIKNNLSIEIQEIGIL